MAPIMILYKCVKRLRTSTSTAEILLTRQRDRHVANIIKIVIIVVDCTEYMWTGPVDDKLIQFKNLLWNTK